MNKQIGKNMFDGMELPEQTKQEVWGNLESIISNTTVEKRVRKNRVWVRRLGKTAAAFLIMGVLFGTINGVSHGGLVENCNRNDRLSCEAGFRICARNT